jgi:hypothetical protein
MDEVEIGRERKVMSESIFKREKELEQKGI